MQSIPFRPNPYPGARPYRSGETLYGRDYEIAEISDLLIAERTILLCGPALCGKTSLLQAGVIRAMSKEGFASLPVINVGRGTSPGRGPCPVGSNRYTLSALLCLEESQLPERRLPLECLATLDLAQYLEQRGGWTQRGVRAILIFDQFEEVLSLDPTDLPAKAAFLGELAAILRRPEYWVILSVREEHLPALEPLLLAARARPLNRFRLDCLAPPAARPAIEAPAREAGVPFSREAVQHLMHALRRILLRRADGTLAEGLAPLIDPLRLQLACRHLWNFLPAGAREFRAEDIEASGCLDHSTGRYILDRIRGIARETRMSERAIGEWVLRQQSANPLAAE